MLKLRWQLVGLLSEGLVWCIENSEIAQGQGQGRWGGGFQCRICGWQVECGYKGHSSLKVRYVFNFFEAKKIFTVIPPRKNKPKLGKVLD